MAETTAPAGRSSDGTFDIAYRRTLGLPQVFRTQFDFQLSRILGAASYGGSAAGEALAAAHQVEDGNAASWAQVWSETAERTEALGRESLAAGHFVSAREALLCATTYWRSAGFFALHTDPVLLKTWRKSRACFQDAAALFDPPIEAISIPYENGKSMPGYFMRPSADGGPGPTVIVVGGADSTLEELAFIGSGFAGVQRGYNVLLVEIPGQRGCFYLDNDLIYRPDTEVPMRFVVDYALGRPDVDPERLGAIGLSWGGHFVPRAAAFDERIKAVVANALVLETRGIFMLLHGIPLDAPSDADFESMVDWSDPYNAWFLDEVRWRCGLVDRPLAEYFEYMGEFNLWDSAPLVECPLLALSGPGEGGYIEDLATRGFELLKGPKTRLHAGIGAEAHCQVNSPSRGARLTFDWLDDVFRLSAAHP
jgi:hypothetical protein